MDIRDAELAGNYNEFIIIILQIQHAVEMDMPLLTAASIPRDEQDKYLAKKKQKCCAWCLAVRICFQCI